LAWTDSDGNFSRWQKPIPDNLADHYQLASSSKAAGNYPTNTDLSAPADVDAQLANVEMADLDDDWIIDDTDGQMIDDDPSASQKGEMVKEMGMLHRFASTNLTSNLWFNSEYYKGSTSLPTGLYANGEQKAVSR
jgi:hypothetical protein